MKKAFKIPLIVFLGIFSSLDLLIGLALIEITSLSIYCFIASFLGFTTCGILIFRNHKNAKKRRI